jgi:hypothetical protein
MTKSQNLFGGGFELVVMAQTLLPGVSDSSFESAIRTSDWKKPGWSSRVLPARSGLLPLDWRSNT